MAGSIVLTVGTMIGGSVLSDLLASDDFAKLNEAISRMDRTELAGLSLMKFLCAA